MSSNLFKGQTIEPNYKVKKFNPLDITIRVKHWMRSCHLSPTYIVEGLSSISRKGSHTSSSLTWSKIKTRQSLYNNILKKKLVSNWGLRQLSEARYFTSVSELFIHYSRQMRDKPSLWSNSRNSENNSNNDSKNNDDDEKN